MYDIIKTECGEEREREIEREKEGCKDHNSSECGEERERERERETVV